MMNERQRERGRRRLAAAKNSRSTVVIAGRVVCRRRCRVRAAARRFPTLSSRVSDSPGGPVAERVELQSNRARQARGLQRRRTPVHSTHPPSTGCSINVTAFRHQADVDSCTLQGQRLPPRVAAGVGNGRSADGSDAPTSAMPIPACWHNQIRVRSGRRRCQTCPFARENVRAGTVPF